MPERPSANSISWKEKSVRESNWLVETDYEQSHEWQDLTRNIATTPKQQLRNWLNRRIWEASRALDKDVEIDPSKYGGTPVVRGTRFKLAQLLATLAEGEDINELAGDMNLDEDRLRNIIRNLSTLFDRPPQQ